LRASALFASRAIGCGASFGQNGVTGSISTRSVWRMRTERTRFLMCAGVVPQQPPTRATPAAMKRRAYEAMYSGVHR
jgi:hypothetical protein